MVDRLTRSKGGTPMIPRENGISDPVLMRRGSTRTVASNVATCLRGGLQTPQHRFGPGLPTRSSQQGWNSVPRANGNAKMNLRLAGAEDILV